MSEPKQKSLDFDALETEDYAGVKHEWTGTLYVPTADEIERIETEAAARERSPIVFSEPILYVQRDVKRAAVKMKMKDGLRLRQRGA